MTGQGRGMVGSGSAGDRPTQGCPGRALPYSPLLRVQITAAHGNGEEARGAVWGAIAVQEASHIEAKVHGARQVVWVSVHPPDDLSSTGPAVTQGSLGLGTTQEVFEGGYTRPGCKLLWAAQFPGASLTCSLGWWGMERSHRA